MKDSPYYNQVHLLLRCLPEVGREDCFSLKGGTAINLFVREMPRLSVDIDLTYLPREPWDKAILNVENALNRIADNIIKGVKGAKVHKSKNAETKRLEKLFVNRSGAQIKIEPNPVIRGSVYESKELNLVEAASNLFELDVATSVLSLEDLYGGKLVAALDRQHPRDIFDVKLLLEDEGITEGIRKAFVVYLASHARPIHEVIKPTLRDKKDEFEKEFEGMTKHRFKYSDFNSTRDTLLETLEEQLTGAERQFLVSLQDGKPDWEKLGVSGIEQLPALKWKLQNVEGMDKKKREKAVQELKKKLNL